jgi:SAM-dependent methyltransferase
MKGVCAQRIPLAIAEGEEEVVFPPSLSLAFSRFPSYPRPPRTRPSISRPLWMAMHLNLSKIRKRCPPFLVELYERWVKHPWLRHRYELFDSKHAAELHYWVKTWKRGGGRFDNSLYERFYLEIGGLDAGDFVRGRVVADFGSGPQGSLTWAKARGAARAIGIDVLAASYEREFDLGGQGMEYVESTETSIPLESGSIDVLFAVNAIDHVHDFSSMCSELLRILAPGGLFIASINLDEPPTSCEPQTLSRESVSEQLLDRLVIEWWAEGPRAGDDDVYRHVRAAAASASESSSASAGAGGRWVPRATSPAGPSYLWVRARKPS